MARNLFLFTDGTGNAGGKRRNTNVYRLFRAIDRNHTVEQRSFYDDGVGTADNTLGRVFGGAFGAGLSRNICELYEWLLVNYDHDATAEDGADRIFVFGFSRGAFTARCLAGMVSRCGILKKKVWDELPAPQRKARLRRILWAYRASSDRLYQKWRGESRDFTLARIHFVGVWDTVDAVGVPIDELRPIFDFAFRIVAGRRAYGFHDMELSGVEHARHALAIDDERRTFHPNVWHKNARSKKEPVESTDPSRLTDPANIRQVWFAGAHSNVGGGYPKDQLAHVTLDWMMGELEHLEELDGTQVRFVTDRRREVQAEADAFGRQYDPRTGASVYYRYSPRRIAWFYKGIDDFWVRNIFRRSAAALPRHGIEVHASVFERVHAGPQSYAPLFLPDRADDKFKLTAAYTEAGGPYSRDALERRVADLPERLTAAAQQVRAAVNWRVVARQIFYALFVSATFYTLYSGLTANAAVFEETATADRSVLGSFTLGDLALFLKGLLPDLLAGLVDAAFAHPWSATLYAAVLVLCGAIGLLLKGCIQRQARTVYEGTLSTMGPNAAERASTTVRERA